MANYVCILGLGRLANNLYRSCRDEEKYDTILYLLCTCPVLGRRMKGHLGAYYLEDLNELSCMAIGSLSPFIEVPSGSWNIGKYGTVASQWVLCAA